MKKAILIHNPSAGNGKHTKAELLNIIQKADYKVDYISTDEENWQNLPENNSDIIFVAGGDGTVRKVADVLLKKEIHLDVPMFLLPLGTANNIAKTLNIDISKLREIPQSLTYKKFDYGKISGVEENTFFIESVGAGIFPELIYTMKKNTISDEKPADKLKRTQKTLHKIVDEFKAQNATLNINGDTINGSFLLIEVMNIKSIGPTLNIAPSAKVDDGYFDLVLIREEGRDLLLKYLNDLLEAKLSSEILRNFAEIIAVKNLSIQWEGDKIHVDDNLLTEYNGNPIMLEMTTKPFKIY
tara:strand:- start:2958 stop:3851 length:894 start_codon:yes stop_codon:yes gene_type:complete